MVTTSITASATTVRVPDNLVLPHFGKREAWVPVAEKLAEANGGVLPNPGWLQHNGFKALYHDIWRKPEIYRHIARGFRNKEIPAAEYVILAEKLAKENGGVLLAPARLLEQRYGKLVNAMSRRPRLFAHIHQEHATTGKSPEEWAAIADQLAAQNDGVLPTCKWLCANSYKGVYATLLTHPHLFVHLPRERMVKHPEEYVPIAEALAQKNGGRVPNAGWLQRNHHQGTYTAMRVHPELFAHLTWEVKVSERRGKKNVRLSDRVREAEKLAAKNGGVLPSKYGLEGMDRGGLASSIQRHPERFAHIERAAVPLVPHAAGWRMVRTTRPRWQVFLTALAQGQPVRVAADLADFNLNYVYEAKKEDPLLAKAWRAAVRKAAPPAKTARTHKRNPTPPGGPLARPRIPTPRLRSIAKHAGVR
jgi:hypothetical protein